MISLTLFVLFWAVPPFAGDVIVAIGDSITYGAVDSEGTKGGNTVTGGWVTHLAERLERDYPGRYEVVNSGVGGDTARDVLNRLGDDLFAETPSIAVVAIGTNDTYGSLTGSPGATTAWDYRVVMEKISLKLR